MVETAGSGWTPWRASSTRRLRGPQVGCGAPQGQHGLLQGRRRPGGTVPRAPRAVLQAAGPLSGVALQPLVAGRRCDPKAAAQGPPVGPRLPRQGHKLRPQVAHPSLRKRHIPVLHLIPGCVHHVSEQVSMMSPVCTLRRAWAISIASWATTRTTPRTSSPSLASATGCRRARRGEGRRNGCHLVAERVLESA